MDPCELELTTRESRLVTTAESDQEVRQVGVQIGHVSVGDVRGQWPDVAEGQRAHMGFVIRIDAGDTQRKDVPIVPIAAPFGDDEERPDIRVGGVSGTGIRRHVPVAVGNGSAAGEVNHRCRAVFQLEGIGEGHSYSRIRCFGLGRSWG